MAPKVVKSKIRGGHDYREALEEVAERCRTPRHTWLDYKVHTQPCSPQVLVCGGVPVQVHGLPLQVPLENLTLLFLFAWLWRHRETLKYILHWKLHLWNKSLQYEYVYVDTLANMNRKLLKHNPEPCFHLTVILTEWMIKRRNGSVAVEDFCNFTL